MTVENPEPDYQAELDAAHAAVDAAEQVIKRYYQRTFQVETKADNSPVTQADVESEEAIREILLQRFPSYGFYGEETGQRDVDADFLWLVDPIDGTKSFVRGSPYFSTQIALMHRGRIVVGVSNAPAAGERGSAMLGQGAFLNGERVTTSDCSEPEAAFLSSGNLRTLAGDQRRWESYGRLIARVARTRGYGDFCHYHQLCCGQADIVIESDVNILDIAALSLLVVEAGGCFSDLDGQPVGLQTTSVLAAANPGLHHTIATALDPAATENIARVQN